MIELGTFTGELLDDQYVMVKLLSEVVLPCRPIFSHPLISVPTKDWLDEYKDKFQAVVSYEGGFEEKPFLLGLVPLRKNDFPSEGYDKNVYLISKKFRKWMDDANNKYIIESLDNGKIYLIDKNASEPAVLGAKNETALKELADKIDAIYQALSSATTTPQDGGASFKAAVVTALSSGGFPISSSFVNTAKDTKSEKVFLK